MKNPGPEKLPATRWNDVRGYRIVVPNVGEQNQRAVVVMAKPPRIGEVKTRLCPPFSHPQAARFYECLLQDTVTKMERFPSAQLWIAHTPDGGHYFQRAYGERARLIPQRGEDIGERMHHAFVDLASSGYRQIVVVGSDIPNMTLSSVELAFQKLSSAEHDLVLGPAEDGGYYLIGLRAPEEKIFLGMTWSNPAVLSNTLDRIASLGLRPALLPLAYDVDLEEDLERLWNDFSRNPVLRDEVPKTYKFLGDFFLQRESTGLA